MIEATRVMSAEDALTLWKQPADNVTPTLLDGPTVIAEDGVPIIAVARLAPEPLERLRSAVLNYPCINGVTRGAGIRNRSQVFGNLATNYVLQRSSCRSCAGAIDRPVAHGNIIGVAADLAALLHEMVPAQYDANVEAVSDVLPEWLLPGGLWTSGVLNETSVLPYHRDRNNFDAWSAMPVIRRWTRGGHLHFPELEYQGRPLVAACADGDVLMFNGQRLVHGVTPIRFMKPGGYRYSAVYYPVKKFRTCKTAAEELANAQLRRTTQESGLLERHRAAGYLTGES